MGIFSSQIDMRLHKDAEKTKRAYLGLATSVSGTGHSFSFDPADLLEVDGAIRTCMKYYGVIPGSSLEGSDDFEARIEHLCRPFGMMHRKVRLDEKWYRHAFGAYLGKLSDGTPVALLPDGLRGYCYHDPRTGEKVRITSKTAASIQEDAICFYRPLPTQALTMRDLVLFIFSVFDVSDYLLTFLATLAVTAIGLLPAWAYNIAFKTVVPSGQVALIAPIGTLLMGVTVSTALISIYRNTIMSRLTTKLDIAVEAATFARTLTLPSSMLHHYSSGNLANRIANMSALAESIVTIMLGTVLTTALSFVYLIQIAAYTPILTMPALGVTLIQATITVLVTYLTSRIEHISMESNASLSGVVTALLNGIQKLKLAGAEDRAFARWAKSYSAYAAATYNRPAFVVALPALVSFIGLLGTILIYFLAGNAGISLADYMSFNYAFGQITATIMAFANTAAVIARIDPMLQSVRPILEAVPEASESKPSVKSLSGTIEVKNVTFRYEVNSPVILRNLSFIVKAGEYVAIVGRSGSGKSTILRLLLGLETPEQGSILFSPYSLDRVDVRSLRQHIGTVMQDGKLFLGTILSNITISHPTATLDDAWAAAEIAGIADDIRKMPMGMQTLVTEGGGGISGGQRQRLMIARAVCGKPRILIFDEATSALDNITQRRVTESLDTLKCTRLVIAHRLSTVKHCDRILVLDKGSIVEVGTYNDLIAQGGLFAQLIARQRLNQQGPTK